jgi:hypothetical protein
MSENTKIEWCDHTPLPTGRALGSLKTAASKIGVSFDEYIKLLRAGMKWCTACRMFHEVSRFAKDLHRGDGLSSICAESRNSTARQRYSPKERPKGRRFVEARDGDKEQARGRVNHLVNIGLLSNPNDLPCTDCGHTDVKERRHEYDHYLGYEAKHHEDVEPVCTLCHAKRDSKRAGQSHCIHGHEFTAGNVSIAGNGTRHCKTCMKLHEKNRPPRGPEYWAKVNAKRRKKAAGRLLDGVQHDGFLEK